MQESVVTHVVQMVRMTTGSVTRDMVEQQLGKPVSRRVWLGVDAQLRLREFECGVSIEHGLNNRTFYARVTTAVAPPPP